MNQLKAKKHATLQNSSTTFNAETKISNAFSS